MRLCPPARHVHGGDELCSSACASTKQKEPVEAGEVKFEDVSVNECRGMGTASFWNTSFGTRCVHSLVPVFCWHFSFVFPCGLSVVFLFLFPVHSSFNFCVFSDLFLLWMSLSFARSRWFFSFVSFPVSWLLFLGGFSFSWIFAGWFFFWCFSISVL